MKEHIERQIKNINRFREIAFQKTPIKALHVLIQIYSGFSEEQERVVIADWAVKMVETDKQHKQYGTRLAISQAVENIINIFVHGSAENVSYMSERIGAELSSLREEISILDNSPVIIENTKINQAICKPNENEQNSSPRVSLSRQKVSWGES